MKEKSVQKKKKKGGENRHFHFHHPQRRHLKGEEGGGEKRYWRRKKKESRGRKWSHKTDVFLPSFLLWGKRRMTTDKILFLLLSFAAMEDKMSLISQKKILRRNDRLMDLNQQKKNRGMSDALLVHPFSVFFFPRPTFSPRSEMEAPPAKKVIFAMAEEGEQKIIFFSLGRGFAFAG